MNTQTDLSFLNVLTENPEFMQKALSIASSLASSGVLSNLNPSGANQQSFTPPGNAYSQGVGSSDKAPDISALLSSAFGQSAAGAADGQNHNHAQHSEKPEDGDRQKTSRAGHAERIRLLEAMRPFVPDDRKDKLDFIIRLIGLIQIADKLGLKHVIGGR